MFLQPAENTLRPVATIGRISQITRAALVAIIIILGPSYAYVGANRIFTQWQRIDFASYYYAASLALGGLDIYDDASREAMRLQLGISELPPYIYPPFLASVLKPIALLSFESARHLWLAASILVFLASLILLARTLDLSPRRFLALVAAAIFLPGTWITLWLGQINMFLFLLIVLALYLNKRGSQPAVGISLALATLIKLFPVLLIAYFALKKRLVVVSWAAVALLILSALSILLVGVNNQIYFFTEGMATVARMEPGLPFDQSVGAFLSRLFLQTRYSSPLVENFLLAPLLTVVVSMLFIAVATTAVARRSSTISYVEYSLAIITMLLVSTKSWDHYGVFLLVPLAVMIRQFNIEPSRASRMDLAAIFAFLLLIIQGFWTIMPPSIWVMSLGFYGMLILWGCFVWMSWTDMRSGSRHA